jgi:hypothetical protein
MIDQLTTITLSGSAAVAERQRLLADGTEVNLVCRRRDARGRDISKTVYFGLSGEGAWVAVEDLKNPDGIGVEVAFPDQARELFAAYVERIMIAKMLTNSDPGSPELCDLNPAIEDFVEDLREVFKVEVSPWG